MSVGRVDGVSAPHRVNDAAVAPDRSRPSMVEGTNKTDAEKQTAPCRRGTPAP